MNTEIRSLPIASLVLSQTTAQVERRAHFDAAKLTELAESIKTIGLLQPIVARPDPDFSECFQIVAGERRYLAAQKAGLDAVPVSVRVLNDEQVLEAQLVENLQREDLHELAEAEGYESLAKLGHSADQIADKVGKSKATVYARMKLLSLCKEARKAFYAGKLTASTALLIARIPERLQPEALKEITEDTGGYGAMSYREALDFVHREYTMRLDQVGFSTQDATLVESAGACQFCPKRSGNQPELFGDIKRGDVCTDISCFRSKREAHSKRLIATAAEKGQQVIDGAQAKSITKHGTHHLQGGFVRLDEHCWDDEKNRTYRQILGKQAQPILLVVPDSKEVIEVVEKKAAAPLLKQRGVKSVDTTDYSAQQRAREKKAKREAEYRRRLYSEIIAKVPETLEREDVVAIALAFFEDIWHDTRQKICKAWGWTDQDGKKKLSPDEVGAREIPKLTQAQLVQFLFGLTLSRELNVSGYNDSKPTKLHAAAQRFKVNAEGIRKELADAERAKKKTKASKKKAARKPK